jgi:hypothetical protein
VSDLRLLQKTALALRRIQQCSPNPFIQTLVGLKLSKMHRVYSDAADQNANCTGVDNEVMGLESIGQL